MSADSADASTAGAALATTLAQSDRELRRDDVGWATEETPQVLRVARALGGANVSVTAVQREMGLRYGLKAERRAEEVCATPMSGSRSPPWTGSSSARSS